MTNYAGEQTRIVHTATVNGRALTPADVAEVYATIYRNQEALVEETAMAWDADEARWEYLWSTAGLDPGTYRVRVRVEGIDGGSNWEFRRLRLARNPVPV